jgi:hypothetical protein
MVCTATKFGPVCPGPANAIALDDGEVDHIEEVEGVLLEADGERAAVLEEADGVLDNVAPTGA